MSTIECAGSGRRVKVCIDGENYYFTVGENFIHATVPDENKLDRARERALIEALCQGITVALGGE